MKQLNEYETLPDECAYCGASPAPTKDHVIPRGFQSKGEEPWESPAVRACKNCNGLKAGFDEQARNLLALHQSSAGNASAKKLVDNEIHRSFQKLQKAGRTSPSLEMLKAMEPVLVTGDNGEHEVMMAGMVNRDIFTPWLSYVVRGLSVALFGTRLGEVAFEVRVYSPEGFTGYLNSIKPFEYVVPLASHTRFSYDPLSQPPGYGLWIFQFFGGLGFTVLAFTPEQMVESEP